MNVLFYFLLFLIAFYIFFAPPAKEKLLVAILHQLVVASPLKVVRRAIVALGGP